jgi:hypothetical protein
MILNGIPIPDNQCIGDSLQTLNNAFVSLSTTLNQLTPTPSLTSGINVDSTSTVTLRYDALTRGLSADANMVPFALIFG